MKICSPWGMESSICLDPSLLISRSLSLQGMDDHTATWAQWWKPGAAGRREWKIKKVFTPVGRVGIYTRPSFMTGGRQKYL